MIFKIKQSVADNFWLGDACALPTIDVMQSLNSGNAPDQRMKVGRTQAQLNNMF